MDWPIFRYLLVLSLSFSIIIIVGNIHQCDNFQFASIFHILRHFFTKIICSLISVSGKFIRLLISKTDTEMWRDPFHTCVCNVRFSIKYLLQFACALCIVYAPQFSQCISTKWQTHFQFKVNGSQLFNIHILILGFECIPAFHFLERKFRFLC